MANALASSTPRLIATGGSGVADGDGERTGGMPDVHHSFT